MSASVGPTAAGRIVSAVTLSAGLALTPPALRSLAAAGLVATILVVASPERARALRVALPVALLAAVTTLPLIASGGVALAGRIAVRSVLSTVAAVTILAPVPLPELEGALLVLGAPRALAATVAGTLRQWSRLTEEGRRLLLARSLRGPLHARDGAALLGALFARTADRAERMELAMALRGYAPERAGRSARFAARDALFVGLSAAAAALVLGASRIVP